MKLNISPDKAESGRRAAEHGADIIRQALADRGEANVVLATGASQFEMLGELTKALGIRWDKVTAFNLDEYPGMPITHPASFRKYLWERFMSKLPLPLRAFNYVDGEGDLHAECKRIGAIIKKYPIDVAFVGIGENGHLAFNDPPADFDTDAPFIVVKLDDACRRQQFNEGWFASFNDVPREAITMTCRQIMKAKAIICSVPDQRKAKAIQSTVEGPVTNSLPASILQRHEKTTIYLDKNSASLLAQNSSKLVN